MSRKQYYRYLDFGGTWYYIREKIRFDYSFFVPISITRIYTSCTSRLVSHQMSSSLLHDTELALLWSNSCTVHTLHFTTQASLRPLHALRIVKVDFFFCSNPCTRFQSSSSIKKACMLLKLYIFVPFFIDMFIHLSEHFYVLEKCSDHQSDQSSLRSQALVQKGWVISIKSCV